MKAISLLQPWASLVALGAKQYETRSWATPYRGPLAIHASARFPGDLRDLCDEEPFRSLLARHGLTASRLPLGRVLCVTRLAACAATPSLWGRLTEQEEALGDFSLGRFAWRLEDVRRIPPIAARGSLGLWDWDPGDALAGVEPEVVPSPPAPELQGVLGGLFAEGSR